MCIAAVVVIDTCLVAAFDYINIPLTDWIADTHSQGCNSISTLAVRIVHVHHGNRSATLRITTISIVFLTLDFEHFLNFNTEMLRLLIQLFWYALYCYTYFALVTCMIALATVVAGMQYHSMYAAVVTNNNNSYSYTAVT